MLGTPEGREERLMPGQLGTGGWRKTFPSLGKRNRLWVHRQGSAPVCWQYLRKGSEFFCISGNVDTLELALQPQLSSGFRCGWGWPTCPGPCCLRDHSDLSKPVPAMPTQNEDSSPYSRPLKSFPGDFFATLRKRKGWPLKMTVIEFFASLIGWEFKGRFNFVWRKQVNLTLQAHLIII